jgi:hypothetical protein
MGTLGIVLIIIGMMVVIGWVYDFIFWKYLLVYRKDRFLRGLGLDEMIKGGIRYEEKIKELMEKGLSEAGLSDDVIIKLVEDQIKDALFKIELSIIQLDNISRTRIEEGVKEIKDYGESQYKHIQDILNTRYENDVAVRDIDPEALNDEGEELSENDPERTEQPKNPQTIHDVFRAHQEQIKPKMYTLEQLREKKIAVLVENEEEAKALGIKDFRRTSYWSSSKEGRILSCYNWSNGSSEYWSSRGFICINFSQVILPEANPKIYILDDLFNEKLAVRVKNAEEAKLLGVGISANSPVYPTYWSNSKYREYSRQGDWTYCNEQYWLNKGYTIIDFNQVIINKNNDNNSSN